MPRGIYKRTKKRITTEETKLKIKLIALEKGFGKWMIGKKHSKKTKLKMSKMRMNHSVSVETRNKIGLANEKEIKEGEDVSYSRIHHWIVKKLGKPDKCEHCGISGLFGRKINWANKSYLYKNDVKDWIRLCLKCHRLYDKNRYQKHV